MERLSLPWSLLAAFYLMVFSAAATGNAVTCSDAGAGLDAAAVTDRLLSMNIFRGLTTQDGNGSLISGIVPSNESVEMSILWQVITCSSNHSLPIISDVVPVNPWKLEVDRFTVDFIQSARFTVSLAARRIAEVHVIPSLVILHDVTVKLLVSNAHGVSSVAVEGTWGLGRDNSMKLRAVWRGSSMLLSVVEYSRFLDIQSLLKNVDANSVWNILNSAAIEWELEKLLHLTVDSFNAQVRGTDVSQKFVLRAKGRTTTVLGETATQFLLIHTSALRSKTDVATTDATTEMLPRESDFSSVSGSGGGSFDTDSERATESSILSLDLSMIRESGIVSPDSSVVRESGISSFSRDSSVVGESSFLSLDSSVVRDSGILSSDLSVDTTLYDAHGRSATEQEQRDTVRGSVIAILVSELHHQSSTSLSTLIKQYTTIDISKFPAFQTSVIDGVVIVSSENLNREVVAELGISELATSCGGIQPGLTVIISLTRALDSLAIFEIYGGVGTDARLCHPSLSSFSPIDFMTSFSPSVVPSLTDLFDFPQLLDVGIKSWRPNGVRYMPRQNQFVLNFHVNKILKLVPRLAEITLGHFQINIPLNGVNLPSFRAAVGWKLGSFKWQGVPFTATNNVYQVRWSGQKLNILDVIMKLAKQFLPSALAAPLKAAHFLDFDIIDPFISMSFHGHTDNFRLRLGGTASFNGWSVAVEGIVWQVDSGYALALGMKISDISIAGLMKTLFGIKFLDSLPFLNSEFTVGFSVSSLQLPDVTFDDELLSRLPIVEGISLIAPFKLPANCGINLLCELVKLGIGSNPVLKSDITSLGRIALRVPLQDISLGLSLKNVWLEFLIDGQAGILLSAHRVGIAAELEVDIAGDKLRFRGAIRQTTGVPARFEMEMSMIGWWNKPFSFPWLAIGNALLRVGFTPAVSLPTLLQLGGDVKIGKIGSDREIQASIDLQLNAENPTDNYFCGRISSLTLGSILNAFGISFNLPPVSDMGFPKGLNVSYSVVNRYLERNDKFLPSGFAFAGTLSFLGIEVTSEIRINLPSFFLKACLNPLNFAGGLIELYKSKSDRTSGPCLKVALSISPLDVDVAINGYLSLLGGVLTTEASLTITKTDFIIEVSGKLFSLEMSLKLSASYSNLLNPSFRVAARLKTNILQSIAREVTSILRSVSDTATSVVEGLQRKFDSAKEVLDKATRFLSARQRDLDNARRKLEGPLRAMEAAQRKVDGLCSIRSCSTFCVGCPGWNGCCTKVWGVCIGCPAWRSCCARVSNPLCVAANVACRLVRGAAYLVLEAAKAAYRVVLLPFEAAKLALEVAKQGLQLAKVPFDVAKAALEVGKVAMQAGLRLAELVVGVVFGGIIDIRAIELEAGIEQFYRARVRAAIDVSFFGRAPVKFSLDVNLNALKIVDFLVEKAMPGVLKIFRGRRSIRAITTRQSGRLLVPWPTLDDQNNTESGSLRVASLSRTNDRNESDLFVVTLIQNNISTQNISTVFDEFAKERIEVKLQTIDRLTNANTFPVLQGNASMRPEMKLPHQATQTPNQRQSGNDKCDTLTNLGTLMRAFSESLGHVYVQWKHSFHHYIKQTHRHRVETLSVDNVRQKTKVTAESEKRKLEKAGDPFLLQQLESEAGGEEVLMDDFVKKMIAWDRSAGSRLVRLNQIGGQLLFQRIDAGFRHEMGMSFLRYIQQQLQGLDDNQILQEMFAITKGLTRTSLRKMVMLIKTMMANINQLEKKMECSVVPVH